MAQANDQNTEVGIFSSEWDEALKHLSQTPTMVNGMCYAAVTLGKTAAGKQWHEKVNSFMYNELVNFVL